MKTAFPRVERWLSTADLDPNHEARELSLSDPIVPALEYFLSLGKVPGFDGWLRRLETAPVGPPTRNARVVSWAGLCAELGATYLIGQQLDLRILGFDQQSPRARRLGSNCDVAAEVDGEVAYFEVKRRSFEDRQTPPPLLRDRLLELDLPYSLSVELLDPDYDCTGLDESLAEIRVWLSSMQDPETRALWWRGEEAPPQFSTTGFSIWFHSKCEGAGLSEFFDPVTPAGLRRWLIEPSISSRDGSQMKPMVEEAREKGADCLLCRVNPGGPWLDLIRECFGDPVSTSTTSYGVRHPALEGIRSLILFSRYDHFCLIDNETAEGPKLLC